MADAIAHRGPDDSGIWSDAQLGLSLSHRRLAILDLSPAGHQPMVSVSGRYVISFNGEIYNHLLIRNDLQAAGLLVSGWRGHSDTETLLASIEAWGLNATLERINGMFAIALWDRRERQLHLARDRFGEKPLYYGLSGTASNRALIFGSDLRALRAFPYFTNEINRQALASLLRFTSIAAPLTIYAGLHQLLPGHLISFHDIPLHDLPTSDSWWCFRSMVSDAMNNPYTDSRQALEDLESVLTNSIRHQTISDVPLCTFLSGGVDSSLVTALLQANSTQSVRTYTVGFSEDDFNEAPYARAVASYLGTDHNETTLSSDDVLQLIPDLPLTYSEPFADSSQLPTHLVCQQARRSGLTVALGGDGGDELFGGYYRYSWSKRYWDRLAWLPWPLRRWLGSVIRSLPPPGWDALGRPLLIPQYGQKAHKLAERLAYVRTSDDLYRSLVSEWLDPAAILQSDSLGNQVLDPLSPLDWSLPASLAKDPVARMMATDTLNYLPNDILTKVDRAAMSVGLETRTPLLDHHVAYIAWQLPMSMKVRSGINGTLGKWALRQILYKHLPRHLIERPKAGFGMPIGNWLRGHLRGWAEDLLEPGQIQRQGYLRPEPIRMLWRQHLSGQFDHSTRLWTVLMWQAWLAEWG